MKIIFINENNSNQYLKYELVRTVEDILDKDNMFIKVDYIKYNDELSTHFNDLVEANNENDFDVYFLCFAKENELEYYEDIKNKLNLKDNVLVITPDIIINDVKKLLEFIV